MKTVTSTIATIACTIVMSTTLIAAAIGPASAGAVSATVASPPASVA